MKVKLITSEGKQIYETITDENAGATPYQNAKILGNIFDDKDYDGLNTKDDEGKENVEVNLNRYLVTKDIT